jgi:glycosyltransferase involved in cell wall biosynthesis
VIYPPVDLERFALSTKRGEYFLTGGRLVPYKRFDLAIAAFNKMGLPLKIYGTGPAYHDLKEMAKPNIEFLGRVPDEQMSELYGRARAFINPQEEDFGITVVEAMATGCPVIAFKSGGALETVKAGETGVFFSDQEWESLADAVIRFRPEEFNAEHIRDWSMQFSVERFKQEFGAMVEQTWQAYQRQVP